MVVARAAEAAAEAAMAAEGGGSTALAEVVDSEAAVAVADAVLGEFK